MNTSQLTNKSRGSRVTEAQISAMLDYMETNRSLATGKFPGINGRDELRKEWTDLSDHLNMLTGAKKSSAQWHVTWRDLKSRTSIKIRNLRNSRAATGNKRITETELSIIDKRVVGLIGNTYVEGSEDCPDSTPEEQGLLDRLAAGDDTALFERPATFTLFSNSRSNESSDLDEINRSDMRDMQVDKESNVLDNKLSAGIMSSAVEVPRSQKQPVKAQTTRIQMTNISNWTTISNPRRLSTQLHDSKEGFMQIAHKQANTMEVITDAMKMQAEASLVAANAAQQQAANDAVRVEVFKQLTDVLSQLLPQYAE